MGDEVVEVLAEAPVTLSTVLEPESWLKKIEFIRRLSLDNNLLMVLLGEQGTGKTTFVSLLHASLAPQISSYTISASPVFDEAVFLDQLGGFLSFQGGVLLSDVSSHCNAQKSQALLIIDDAHYLPRHFIETILNEIQLQGKHAYFHVLLVSDFSIVPLLNQLVNSNDTDLIHSLELEPWNMRESKTVLTQDLLPITSVDGGVTEEQLTRFYQLTTRFWGGAWIRSGISSSLISRIGAVLGVAMVATGFLYIWQSHSARLMETPQVRDVHPVQAFVRETQTPILGSEIPAFNELAVRQAVLATPLRKSDLIHLSDEDEALDSSLVVMDKVVVAPKVIRLPMERKPIHPQIAKQNKSKTVSKAPIKKIGYTIQLIAGHSKTKLERFMALHPVKGNLQYRRTWNQGKVWYIVTLGEFGDRQHAKNAMHALPKEIVQCKPWVRPISELRDAG